MVTSRECWYPLLCEASARQRDGFGSGWRPPKAAVWPDRVGVSPPSFDDEVGVFARGEHRPVAPRLTHRSGERFTVAMLPGRAWLHLPLLNVQHVLEPGLQVPGHDRWAVLRPNVGWSPVSQQQLGTPHDHVLESNPAGPH